MVMGVLFQPVLWPCLLAGVLAGGASGIGSVECALAPW